MRTWISKHPSASFYLLTLTLSWGYWLTLVAQTLLVFHLTHNGVMVGALAAAIKMARSGDQLTADRAVRPRRPPR